MDRQREKMRGRQRQTRAGVIINLASERSMPHPKPTVHHRVRPIYPGPGPSEFSPPSLRCPTPALYPGAPPGFAPSSSPRRTPVSLLSPASGSGGSTDGRGGRRDRKGWGERGKVAGGRREGGCGSWGCPWIAFVRGPQSALPNVEWR